MTDEQKREYNKKWRQENRDKQHEYSKRYFENHRDKWNAYQRKRYKMQHSENRRSLPPERIEEIMSIIIKRRTRGIET